MSNSPLAAFYEMLGVDPATATDEPYTVEVHGVTATVRYTGVVVVPLTELAIAQQAAADWRRTDSPASGCHYRGCPARASDAPEFHRHPEPQVVRPTGIETTSEVGTP